MKFGIFYEHQIPKPWTADSERRTFHESLEQIELADRLGFDRSRLGALAVPTPSCGLAEIGRAHV